MRYFNLKTHQQYLVRLLIGPYSLPKYVGHQASPLPSVSAQPLYFFPSKEGFHAAE